MRFALMALMALLCPLLPAQNATFETAVVPVLKQGCIPCHNNGLYSGGLNLEAEFSQAKSLITQHEAWERILKRMRNGTMPPRQAPKPAGLDQFIAFLEKTLESVTR
jgi:hypothetical protein